MRLLFSIYIIKYVCILIVGIVKVELRDSMNIFRHIKGRQRIEYHTAYILYLNHVNNFLIFARHKSTTNHIYVWVL